jgi:hypothetical protein
VLGFSYEKQIQTDGRKKGVKDSPQQGMKTGRRKAIIVFSNSVFILHPFLKDYVEFAPRILTPDS